MQNVLNECKELATTFTSDLEHFINQALAYNKHFRYWSIFLDELIPVINDLTLSFRESNWLLYLSALRRAMPLFFAFDWTNYSRWVQLYYLKRINFSANQFSRISRILANFAKISSAKNLKLINSRKLILAKYLHFRHSRK